VRYMSVARTFFATVAIVLILMPTRVGAFTYQGRLTESGWMVNGLYDLRFRLALDPGGNIYLQDSFMTNGVSVVDGIFTVKLEFDSSVFAEPNLWLEVAVRTNGATTGYTILTPLQPLTAVPYALMVSSAGSLRLSGELAANGLRVTNASTFSGPATFNSSLNVGSSSVFSNSVTILGTVAMKGGVVYVPSGGEITNVFKNLSNDMHIVLLAGTNVVSTYGSGVGMPLPHLFILNKTNIVIEGLGWHSVVHTPQTGTVFRIENSCNITFRNFRVTGTRGPNAGHVFTGNGQFAAFDVKGANDSLTWEGVSMRDHHNFAIASLSVPRDSTRCTVRNCEFVNIGGTNLVVGTLVEDGGGIVILGPDMIMTDNYFDRCRMCVEMEGTAPTIGVSLRRIVFSRNVCKNTYRAAFWGVGGTDFDNWTEFIITENQMDFDLSTQNFVGPNAGGIEVTYGQNGVIANNVIRTPRVGISMYPAIGRRMEGWTINDNVIHGAYHWGIALIAVEPGLIRGTIVSGNQISHSGNTGVRVDGVNNLITGNVLRRVGTNSAEAAIRVIATGAGSADSNVVAGNYVFLDPSSSRYVPAYGLEIMSGVRATVVENNQFRHFATAAWLDSGIGSEFRNNWIGSNIASRNLVLDATFTTNCTPAMTIGAPQSLRLRLVASAPVTLDDETSIGDGYYDGQEVALIGTSNANTVELHNQSNVRLNGGTNKVLGRGDVLKLIWDAVLSDWVQAAPLSDN
jgi:hypothetical protein